MGRFYRRDGTRCDLMEWAHSLERHEDRIVKQHRFWWGGRLSTVWLGLDHSFGEGPPLIFESMVFAPGSRPEELDQVRYSTEQEALLGHARLLRKHFLPWAVCRALWRHESRMLKRIKKQWRS